MKKIFTFQTVITLAAGSLFGYLMASGRFNTSDSVNASEKRRPRRRNMLIKMRARQTADANG